MTSLREIKERLAAIEQSQGVLCERLDANAIDFGALMVKLCDLAAKLDKISMEDQEHYNRLLIMISVTCDTLSKKLDAIQGALLHEQFRKGKGGKPCRKSKSKK